MRIGKEVPTLRAELVLASIIGVVVKSGWWSVIPLLPWLQFFILLDVHGVQVWSRAAPSRAHVGAVEVTCFLAIHGSENQGRHQR